jgi:Domain of unknown function (DUF4396)
VSPSWLTVVAWIWLIVGFASACLILFDIFVRGHRQQMAVMDAVYPITALYLGPAALLLYWRWGRNARDMVHMSGHPTVSRKPRWVSIAIEVSHCGAGCTLGDVIAEWATYALGLTLAGSTLAAEYVGDYILALGFGIVFQYFAIAPMRGLGLRDGLVAAAKADFISLTFFEVGLFGWMALMNFIFFPAPHQLMPSSPAFWFLMQIGMIVGFVTSWPANVWLIDRGIKVAM